MTDTGTAEDAHAPVLPPVAESEAFRGYDQDDYARVLRWQGPAEAVSPEFYRDFFGVKIRKDRASWTTGWGGLTLTEPPFPRDNFIAEGMEYGCATLALEAAAGASAFTFVEIGAGWGPWTALMATLARRAGFQTVNAVGVEAHEGRHTIMREHLADNGLLPSTAVTEHRANGVFVKAICAAGWYKDTTLKFPASGNDEDAGMAVSQSGGDADYRGQAVRFEEVPALSIEGVCADFPVVDFLHIDIQGAEWDVIRHSLPFLKRKVRHMYVGTHSRKIEGDLIELLLDNGFALLREKPCRFYPNTTAPTLVGKTYEDGGQFWLNPRI